MRVTTSKLGLVLLFSLLLACGHASAQAPLTISGISPSAGPVGTPVTISGLNFGTTQGTSTVSLNGTSVSVTFWSDTSIVGLVPSGATSGTISVTVNNETAASATFTITSVPSTWTDQDVGSVGESGSASYSNGTFTVQGSGTCMCGTADSMNFLSQSISGDGSIVARVVSSSGGQVGVMIRETLNAGATDFYAEYQSAAYIYPYDRSSTGASASSSGASYVGSLPYWIELVRSGSTFTSYASPDGFTWTQLASQTITMASNAYMGLVLSSQNNSGLATATFDNVSVSPNSSPSAAITSLSATSGPVGTQVTINGSGFGTSQGVVTLSATPVPVASWNNTAIGITIPSGASSGNIVVSTVPGLNDSNPVEFDITTQPLPSSWLDADIGSPGVAGTATYASSTFTVKGSGTCICSSADSMHFAYQPLSGDGTIVARIVSETSSTSVQAGIMIRETLNNNATSAFVYYDAYSGGYITFDERSSTGGYTSQVSGGQAYPGGLPYWIELVRSGNTFSAYTSADGMYWSQLGSTQTITMATNVYVGLAITSQSNSSLGTATFDSVSISSASNSAPVITSLSATTGPIGSQVAISGSGFGVTQGNSLVTLGGVSLSVNTWSSTQILTTIPSGATSGAIVVSVAPSMNNSNPVQYEVTTQPLPSTWLDQDVGTTGVIGTATNSSGTFTVKGSGSCICSTADAMHFVYQTLSGNGSITARVVSSSGGQAGIIIRETLAANATTAFIDYQSSYIYFYTRTSTGGSLSNQGSLYQGLPYWVQLVRSGNTFTAYTSQTGLYWTQLGSQTITMATNVYVGLADSSENNSSLDTATFDNVSVSSTATPAPAITSLSASTGSVGSQITINGSGFGSVQATSAATLNGASVTINSWSNTAIVFTVPTGATSGYLVVSVAPSMDNTNPVAFEVTSQPLPNPWVDEDLGNVGVAGSATYSSGTFTVQASGTSIGSTSDGMHFVYQPLSGDGSIVARVASAGTQVTQAGVMIRETLDPSATDTSAFYKGYVYFYERPSTGASTVNEGNTGNLTLPYWVKLIRSAGMFSTYTSPDGSTWTQVGSTQTLTMATNTYVGLAVGSDNNSALATATFDNVTVTVGTTPFVTSVYPVLGGIGSSVTLTGSNFGSSQGTSTVAFNGVSASSYTSWTSTQVVAVVPSGATTGQVSVTVNSTQSPANPSFTVINPVITSITPPAAQAGSVVTIAGSGFGGSTSMGIQWVGGQANFNGSGSPAILSWSNTSITAQVPTNATTGPVTIVENGVTSSGFNFTVLEALTVTGVSPSGGAVGATVTISGTGFGPNQSNSSLIFNGTTATINSWSDTSISAVVPSGVSTGPVSVQVAGNTDWGPTFTLMASAVLTDSLSNQTTYTAAESGGKWYVSTSQGSGCSSCTIRGNIQSAYDSYGNVTSTTDARGNTTSYTYDSNNNVASVTQPAVGGSNPKTTYTYNTFGEVLTMTDALANVTSNTYDSHGNLLTVTTPAPNGNTAPSVTQFAYNSLGELTQITDPLGNVTKITYTTAGLIATITDAQNNVTTYGYDSRGNRTSITDALNHQTTFTYDSGNRLTQITYPDTTTKSFTYDYRGRRITAKDQNGKTTTYAYDDADRLTSVTDAANNVTQYSYDTESNLLSITDANSHQTSFTYDAFGRVTQTEFPSTLTETYAYDANNNLTSKTDRKNQTIQYVYDAINRLTQKTYPDSATVQYTYDLVGKVLQLNDPTGTYSFSYDNMGRLTGTTTQYAFLSGSNFTNSYSYDADSNRVGFTAPDGSTNTYSYDSLNRLTTLANSWAGSFGFGYDALSRRTQMTRPNNVVTNYSYDNLSHLLSILHKLSGSTIDGSTYTVDSAGNRTANENWSAGVTSNYSYDAIYELTQVTQGTNTTESYSFDPVGNRLSSLGLSPYSYNTSNELTSTPSASYTYDYDGNSTGKTVSSNTTGYSWDYENRMTSVTLPNSGGTVTFKYDPFGRRIYKQSATTTSIFVYDTSNLVETVNSGGGLVARYAQGQNIDEPLAESVSGAVSYYEQDGQGSVTSLTATNGAIGQSYTYDSFGEVTNSSGSLTNPFRYAGREFDTETSLYYNRARYYDPALGRFVSEDPTEFYAGVNFYTYVRGNPLRYRDPFGLSASSVISSFGWGLAKGAAGAVIVGAIAAGAVTIGAPVAVVTGVLGAAAVVGGAILGVDLICNIENHNWNGVAGDIGSIAGGSVAGGLGGGAMAEGINGVPSPPWSLSSDAGDMYDPNFPGGSVGQWLGKGPNPASAGASAALAGSGAANAGTVKGNLLSGLCGCK